MVPITLAAQTTRPTASAATPMDTLNVIAGPGIRGFIGGQAIRTRDLAADDMRTLSVVAPRGTTVQYTVAADTGYENPLVMFDDDSVAATGVVTLTGGHTLIIAAERTIVMGSANRKLYDLLRQQLIARDPLSVYVDIECETERLLKAFPDSAERLIDAAQQKAVDPMRDEKALRRIDAALGGHMFEGCARDRRTYQRASQKPSPAR